MIFTYAISVKSGKLKEKKQNQNTLQIEKVIYSVLHERSNNTASFAVHQKPEEKLTFADALWINFRHINLKKTRIRTMYILKLLYAGCSSKEAIKLLPLRST